MLALTLRSLLVLHPIAGASANAAEGHANVSADVQFTLRSQQTAKAAIPNSKDKPGARQD
jgi:hypothetical protein